MCAIENELIFQTTFNKQTDQRLNILLNRAIDSNICNDLNIIAMRRISPRYNLTLVNAIIDFNPNQVGGGAKWPTANQNNYSFATGCPIDLKPTCIFKFVHCIEEYKKN